MGYKDMIRRADLVYEYLGRGWQLVISDGATWLQREQRSYSVSSPVARQVVQHSSVVRQADAEGLQVWAMAATSVQTENQ